MARRALRPGNDLSMLVPLAGLVLQHVRQLDFLPVATLGLLGVNAFIFLGTVGRRVEPYCISAAKLLRGDSWRVLYTNTFVHADQMHLYYNSLSFLHKATQLEGALGTAHLLLLIALCCALTPAYYILLEVVGARLLPALISTRDCAVGFSGVIFALKVICQHLFPQDGSVMGITMPSHLLAWGELVAISLVTPNASFVGHLAGILAGLTVVLLGVAGKRRQGGRRNVF